jgi:membrane protein required for colicin V production
MGIYDTIMLLLLGAATFIGWRKGMVSQVAAIVSLLASFFVAANFYQRVAGSISAAEPWNSVAAFVIVYLATSFVIWLFFKQIRRSVNALQLTDFDRQMGALLGLAKGVAIVTLMTLVAVNLLTPGPREAIAQSRSGTAVQKVVYLVSPIMPARVQDFLAGYVQRLDEVLGTGQDPYQAGGGYPYGPPSRYPPGSNEEPTFGSNAPPFPPGSPTYQPPQYIPPQPSQPAYEPAYDWRSSAQQDGPRYE